MPEGGQFLRRPLAPGMYNITAAMPGYAAETVTVVVPESGEGVQIEFFLAAAEGLGGLAGLARKFGPFQLAGEAAGGAEGEQGGQVRTVWSAIQEILWEGVHHAHRVACHAQSISAGINERLGRLML
jgi:hypothetical protein